MLRPSAGYVSQLTLETRAVHAPCRAVSGAVSHQDHCQRRGFPECPRGTGGKAHSLLQETLHVTHFDSLALLQLLPGCIGPLPSSQSQILRQPGCWTAATGSAAPPQMQLACCASPTCKQISVV